MNNEVRFFIANFVNILAELLILAIFFRILLSWFKPLNGQQGKISLFLRDITEPLLSLIRKILPKTGMIDLSPIAAFFLIELLRSLILNIL